MKTFLKGGKGILVGLMLTTVITMSGYAQTMASGNKSETLAAPKALEAVMYQIPETTKFKVHFLNNSGRKVTVQLRDAQNQLVYSEVVSGKNYIRKFDLNNLSDGAYRFEISNGNQYIVKEVALQTVSARSVQVE